MTSRQALPKHGYTAMFEKILLNNPDITVRLNVDYFAVKVSKAWAGTESPHNRRSRLYLR